MQNKRCWFQRFAAALFIMLGSAVWAELPPIVQVRLFEAHPTIHHIRMQGPFQVTAPMPHTFSSGEYQINLLQGKLQLQTEHSKQPVLIAPRITIKPVQQVIGIQPELLSARHYSGNIEFSSDSSGNIRIQNQVPTRTYVAVVVSSETLPGWPLEALKAQAVLTQTRLSRYQQGDALGDSTQKEAYLGMDHLRPDVVKAVNSVWGQTLVYQGQVVTPFYHASCGGHTSNGQFFNAKKPIPWLSSVTCPYCRLSPFSKPTHTTINQQAWVQTFASPLPKISHVDAAGRPLSIQLGHGNSLSGYQFWLMLGQHFGWDKAPGTRFSIKPLNDGKIQITSTGAGHGVGLCQWGAAEMARQGKTYREILHFYFPKTELKIPSHGNTR